MQQSEIDTVMSDSVTAEVVERCPVLRLAYTGRDGAPRVVPVSYLLRDGKFVFCTIPSSAKVAALQADGRVAITIDTPHPQLCCLLVRGTADVEVVDGVPEEYLEASFRSVPVEQQDGFAEQVGAMYTRMARITVTPTFVRLNDFQRTAPRAVEELMQAHAGGSTLD